MLYLFTRRAPLLARSLCMFNVVRLCIVLRTLFFYHMTRDICILHLCSGEGRARAGGVFMYVYINVWRLLFSKDSYNFIKLTCYHDCDTNDLNFFYKIAC